MHDTPYDSVLDLIGATPLLRLRSLDGPGQGSIYAKLEMFNPGGSVKDRAALQMILDAEEAGHLQPGGTIVEPTAGNMGIGLAIVGAARGYRVILVVPARFSREKLLLMEALGAELVLTPAAERMPGAIARAQELAATIPDAFVPQQFTNPSNPMVHYRTTAREIWEQMGERVDAVVIGAGTGGTFTGVSRYMKKRSPQVRAVLVEPEGSIFGGGDPGPHRVEGIGNAFWPEVLDRTLIDEVITVADGEAFEMVRHLARREGILVGGSAGANVVAARSVAAGLPEGAHVVTVAPDPMERYLSRGPAGDSQAAPPATLEHLEPEVPTGSAPGA